MIKILACIGVVCIIGFLLCISYLAYCFHEFGKNDEQVGIEVNDEHEHF